MDRSAHRIGVVVKCFNSSREHRTSSDGRTEFGVRLAHNEGHWRAITSRVIHLLIIC